MRREQGTVSAPLQLVGKGGRAEQCLSPNPSSCLCPMPPRAKTLHGPAGRCGSRLSVNL